MPRQSAAVYRRRRLAVLTIALLTVALIAAGVWLAIAQPWATTSSSDKKPTPETAQTPTPDAEESPTPDASGSPEPSPDPSATPTIIACEAANIAVVAETDADTYAAGAMPKLSIELTNKGSQDCTMDVGSSTQKFTVTSGSDRWWTSTDCQTDPSSLIVTLKAGESVTSATPVVWDRTRSSVSTCQDETRPRAPGGGASYHVSVSIGGFESAKPKQFLLN